MTFPTIHYRQFPILLIFGLAFVNLGCGGGDDTFRVTGKVTFDGKPVPKGKIYFMPDSSKGNTGPSGFADIIDGQYDTRATGGRGIVGGATIVAIEGFDPQGSPTKDLKKYSKGPDKLTEEDFVEVSVQTLFPRYEVKEEFPAENTTKDFEVPAEAAKGPTAPKTPQFVDP